MPKIKREFKHLHTRHDSAGNALIVEQEPLFKNYRIYLSLAAEGSRRRLIGEVDTEAKMLMVKRDRAKHYHRISMSYGFNKVVIEEMAIFRRVLLIEKDGDKIDYYLIKNSTILEKGNKLNFITQGFELQWFLPFKIIMEHKIDVEYREGKLRMVQKINNEKSTI